MKMYVKCENGVEYDHEVLTINFIQGILIVTYKDPDMKNNICTTTFTEQSLGSGKVVFA